MSASYVISIAEAQALIAAQEVTILDMRDHRSFRAGHIDGARVLHDGLEQALVDAYEVDKPILIYCFRGIQSKEKAEHFERLGFNRVYSLEGGFTAWPRDEPSPFQKERVAT
jgi:thiosulfate sulfurtransferase